jgi:hypothetical protein
MPATARRKFAQARRRQQVAELYLKGWSQPAIAQELNVAQSTVNSDIRAVEQEWIASGVRDFDLARELELQKLKMLERESWDAWKRSQKPAQSATVTGEGTGNNTRKNIKNQVGDPRFLDQINRCIAQRRTLLGLDAPLQVADVTVIAEETPEERRARLNKIFRTIVVEPTAKRRLTCEDAEEDS